MNDFSIKQPPNETGQDPTRAGLFTQTIRSLAVRFFQFTDRYKYAPLGAASAAGIAIFSLGAAACSVLGILGSTVLLTLVVLSLVTFSTVHSLLLYRSRAQAQAIIQQPSELFEIRKQLDELLPRVDEQTGAAFQRIVHQYEDQIRDFQDTLSRLRPREIPGKPVLMMAGPFMMGSKKGDTEETPRHQVYVSAFLVDQYPVSNKQFAQFVNDPANRAWRRDEVYERYGIPYHLVDWDGLVPPPGRWDHPVVFINWFACCAFCNWRSRCDGLQEVYAFITDHEVKADLARDGWRLPTEAEWEKAARGGHDNLPFPWDGPLTPTRANYGKHYRGTTPVGQFPANDFGVSDMLGNVKEWCHDCYCATIYADRAQAVARDPVANDSGAFRVFRGGSWLDQPEWIRLSKRGRIYAQNMNQDFGFRCVRRP